MQIFYLHHVQLEKEKMINKNKITLFATCGVSLRSPEYYFKKNGYLNFKFVNDTNADYIIMTNRTVFDNKNNQITNCFDKFK